MLLLRPGGTHQVEAIVDGLWGENAPSTAVKTIQKYVSQLRKHLGDVIVTAPRGYALVVPPDTLDVHRFEELIERARDHESPADVADSLTQALALWRGVAFAELLYSDYAVAERARLDEKRLSATEDLIDAELALGRHAHATSELEQLVSNHPLRERLWGQLMLALYRAGRQAAALEAYQRLRRILVDEFAIEPSPELQDLQLRVLNRDPTLMPAETITIDRRHEASHLPAQLTSFVGRAAELRAIAELTSSARLVTLTGPAGSGKTRLALEVAQSARRYPDGVWLVDLVMLTSPEQIPGAFAAPFRLGEQPGLSMQEVLVEYFFDKEALIVVDNCEHVIEPVATLVANLLGAVDRLNVLATSREPLAVPGEMIFEVSPLEIPGPQEDLNTLSDFDSIRLFVERARAVDVGFTLSAENGPAVASICRRLDGIPLALELAAAMLRPFGPQQLVGLLEEHFDVLSVAPRRAHARHRTLRAAIDWSYELLSEDEKAVFNQLGVFHGSFDLVAAQRVCVDDSLSTDVLAIVSALVGKSLVTAMRLDTGTTRFRLLETLRDYALRELDSAGETPEIKRRHAVYYRDLAETADEKVNGPDQDEWLDLLRVESGNIRAALAWALESGEFELGLRLASAHFSFGAVFWFWDMRGSSPIEGLAWLREALARDGHVADSVRAKALTAAGFLAESQGEHHLAHQYGEEGRALYEGLGDETGTALATLLLGEVAHYRGRYDDAIELLNRSLEVFTRLGDRWKIAWTFHRLGMVARLTGDYARARSLHSSSLEIFRSLGDHSRIAYSLWALGVVARYQGDYASADDWCRESLHLFEKRGDKSGVAHVRETIADIARLQGDLDRAEKLYEECRTEFQEIGDRRCVASSFANLGAVAHGRADDDRAEALYRESLAIRSELDDVVGVAECLNGLARGYFNRGHFIRATELVAVAATARRESGAAIAGPERKANEKDLELLRTAMGADAFNQAWARGLSMRLDDVVASALASK